MHKFRSSLLLLITLIPQYLSADEIRIAVASNFTASLKHLATELEQQTGHKVTLSAGSSGKHYAQISHGAPFHAFFAADIKRPALLEKSGTALHNSRFSYACCFLFYC